MSHANGYVFKDGKIVGYFEYNGTVDCVCTKVHASIKGVEDNWRSKNCRDCSCGVPGKDVLLATDYGFDGMHWPGNVCFVCMAITDGFFPYSDDGVWNDGFSKDGYPEGAEAYEFLKR